MSDAIRFIFVSILLYFVFIIDIKIAHIMSMKLPMAVLDQCVGHKIWIVMKGKREFSGILRGFDDYFNAVLEDVI